MTNNVDRAPKPDTQDDYESTVLGFLDREMATIQQVRKQDEQSGELDALVNDMLKQVITEADQILSADKPLFDEDELFAGLISDSQQSENAAAGTLAYSLPSTPSDPGELPRPEVENTAATEQHLAKSAATQSVPTVIFSSSMTAPRGYPVKAAVAVAGLAILIGSGVYYFSRGSASKDAPQPVATRSAQGEIPASGAAVQAAVPALEMPGVTRKPAASIPPAAAPRSATAKKPPSRPVSENVYPPPTERIPAQPPQEIIRVHEQPSPAPATPVASDSLIPAVAIVQASPVYPEVAIRTGSSGDVVLELQIDDQGKVVKATPVSGPAVFHDAAVTAAMQWQYRPASISGRSVTSQNRVTMSFNLKK